MKKAKKVINVFTGHTLEEYKSLYDIDKTIHIDKETIDKFHRKHPKAKKNILLDGRSWWLIDDTYYEIDRRISPSTTISKVKKSNAALKIALAGILGIAGVGGIGAGSYLIIKKVIDNIQPQPVPEHEYLIFDGCSVRAKNTSISGKIVIPSTNPATGETITKVANSGFADCTKIKEIEFPDTITEFGTQAFNNCRLLKNCEIPKGVKIIPNKCFQCCTELVSIKIHEDIELVESEAFADCGSLEEIIIDSQAGLEDRGIYQKGATLFHHAKKVYVKEDLDVSHACEDFTKNYTLGESKKEGYFLYTPNKDMIFKAVFSTQPSDYSYYRCGVYDNRPNVEIPSTITPECTHVLSYGFANNKVLQNVSIPDSITTIGTNEGGGSFYLCYNLKSVKMSSNITNIFKESFALCEGLENIELPSKLKTIGDRAFECCYKLKSINIPEAMNEGNPLGTEAFSSCSDLTEVKIDSELVAHIKNNDSCLFDAAETIKVKSNYTLVEGDYIYDNFKYSTTEEGYNIYIKK